MKIREELENRLDFILNTEVNNSKLVSSRFDELKKEGLQESNFSQFLHLREHISAASDFVLFCMCKVYYPDLVDYYFFPEEIKRYNRLKIKADKLKMPIRLEMVQINEQQWVGKITAKELLLWRNAQIINYNENAQRSLRHITKNGRDFYKIALKQKAVNSIMELMDDDEFIPNTLTFNIPDGVKYSFDKESNTFAIDLKGNKLDILDGYHRYIAISKELTKKPDLDITMEIRLVRFSESKAQQFIWQEDQKTKLVKVQSEAMNQLKLANQITQRINDDTNCDLYHHITANGIVNKGYFSQMVDKMYCKNIARKDELRVQKETVDYLVEYLNILVENEPELLEHRWERLFIYCALFMSNKEVKNPNKQIEKLYNKVKQDNKYIFNGQFISGSDLSRLTRLWKEK